MQRLVFPQDPLSEAEVEHRVNELLKNPEAVKAYMKGLKKIKQQTLSMSEEERIELFDLLGHLIGMMKKTRGQ